VDRLVKVGLDVRAPKLTQLATPARDAMHALGVELHYQSCIYGVERAPESPSFISHCPADDTHDGFVRRQRISVVLMISSFSA
jgi:hypothetical protein